MKLIIDIDKETYIKAQAGILGSFSTIISSGKPYEERPQGEWGNWVISEIRCPNCLEYFDTDCYSTAELRKCPNCGAKMKGGAE